MRVRSDSREEVETRPGADNTPRDVGEIDATGPELARLVGEIIGAVNYARADGG